MEQNTQGPVKLREFDPNKIKNGSSNVILLGSRNPGKRFYLRGIMYKPIFFESVNEPLSDKHSSK